MNREQAINYLISSGFTHEQVGEVVRALTYEPTTKNDLGVDCVSRQAINGYIDYILSHGMGKKKSFGFIKKFVDKLPSVTPQLSVPEITALAEWIEKLTKASVEAIPKADYENRLKADIMAMLEELKEQLREMHEDFFETEHFDEAYGVSDSMDIIQEKIDALRGEEK